MTKDKEQLYAIYNDWTNYFQTGMTKSEVIQYIHNFIANADGSPEQIVVYLNPVEVSISIKTREVEVEFK